jgi:hypothetical protein
MDALLLQLISTYAEGAAVCVLSLFLYLSTKRVTKLETKLEDIHKHANEKFFTKEETKEHIAQESRLAERSMISMAEAIGRLEKSNERLDDILNDIRTHLLHNYIKK